MRCRYDFSNHIGKMIGGLNGADAILGVDRFSDSSRLWILVNSSISISESNSVALSPRDLSILRSKGPAVR
jgi:hypothetical protein